MMKKHFGSVEGLVALLRDNLLTGIFVLAPFGVVAWLMIKVFNTFWAFNELLPNSWKPDTYFAPFTAQLLNFMITVGLALVFAFIVSLVGWTSKQYLGKQIISLLSQVVQRIPVIRAVYSSLNQLLKTISSGDKNQFSRVVYLEYPRKGTWALAFVTGTAKSIEGKQKYINVYVPTTPNPTSGFHLIVPESDVKDSGLTVEEAFKTILSLGIAQENKVK